MIASDICMEEMTPGAPHVAETKAVKSAHQHTVGETFDPT